MKYGEKEQAVGYESDIISRKSRNEVARIYPLRESSGCAPLVVVTCDNSGYNFPFRGCVKDEILRNTRQTHDHDSLMVKLTGGMMNSPLSFPPQFRRYQCRPSGAPYTERGRPVFQLWVWNPLSAACHLWPPNYHPISAHFYL